MHQRDTNPSEFGDEVVQQDDTPTTPTGGNTLDEQLVSAERELRTRRLAAAPLLADVQAGELELH